MKNLYYRYEIEKIQTLVDQKARESFKTAIELQLDENISHTSNMCQQAIRKLVFNFMRQVNRSKSLHFSEAVDIRVLQFNRLIGSLIADEFLDFRKIPRSIIDFDDDNLPEETEVMKYCCQFSAVFSEFNKVLFGAWSYGVLFIEFFEKGGLDCIKEMILWLVRYLYKLEKNGQPKSLNQCKNIQLLWSHLIDFFVQLFEGKYIDTQYSQFLISFKTNPAERLKSTGPDAASYNIAHDTANKNMRAYLINLYASAFRFIFEDLNHCKWVTYFQSEEHPLSVFSYFDLISELFLVSMIDIYSHVSKGMKHIKLFQQNQQSLSLDSK